ncbi:hypothetical protein CRG98_039610 [Punica granatum]|uniref:Uncharacterized protein n=1 Tax=Punica granatum TaxID=22663 RepID=A0A2I0I7I7_PUNGR|nr:hypothetical protein CRG98_039610 [Punica granatum]
MDIDGGASIVGSDGGGGTAAWSVTSGGGMLTGWTAGACIEGVSPLSGAWVNGTQGFRSTVSPYPGGGLEFEEVDSTWASGDGIGGGIAPECAGGAPAGVGGGGA